MRATAPIDELRAIMAERNVTSDREFLGYALGRGIVTPAFVLEATGSDRAFYLAEEIAEANAQFRENEKRRAGGRR